MTHLQVNNSRWVLLAAFSAILGLRMATPVYAGNMETGNKEGKYVQITGAWGCDCEASEKNCVCITN